MVFSNLKRVAISLLALTMALLIVFTSCSKLNKIEYSDGVYTDTKTDVSYVRVPPEYIPVATGEKYANIKLTHSNIELCEVVGLDPKMWLSSSDGTLYRNSETKLPAVSELGINKIEFCTVTSAVFSQFSTQNPDIISSLVDFCDNEEKIDYQSRAAKYNYRLLLSSRVMPEIYYSVEFIKYSEDIHVYKKIANENDTEGLTSYEGVKVEVFSEENAEGETVWYADLNYGTAFIYNTADRKCIPIFGLLDGFLE